MEGLPGGLVVKNPHSQSRGAWVHSLVWELRSRMQQEVAKKKKKFLKYGIERASGLANKWRCQEMVHLERTWRLWAPPLYFALHFSSIWLFLSYILLYKNGDLVSMLFSGVLEAALAKQLNTRKESREAVIYSQPVRKHR